MSNTWRPVDSRRRLYLSRSRRRDAADGPVAASEPVASLPPPVSDRLPSLNSLHIVDATWPDDVPWPRQSAPQPSPARLAASSPQYKPPRGRRRPRLLRRCRAPLWSHLVSIAVALVAIVIPIVTDTVAARDEYLMNTPYGMCVPGLVFRVAARAGEILTPGYPDEYPPMQDCRWLIDVSEGSPEDRVAVLKFIDFRLETLCHSERVEIYDGTDLEAPLLARLCGNIDSCEEISRYGGDAKRSWYNKTMVDFGFIADDGWSFFASSPFMLVRFVTDSTWSYRGFRALFFGERPVPSWIRTYRRQFEPPTTPEMWPTTEELPTTEFATAEAMTTEFSTFEAMTTEFPTSEAMTTEFPTSEAMTTEFPTTEAMTTEFPTTEAITTELLSTEAITTELPSTEPMTSAMSTMDWATSAPTTTDYYDTPELTTTTTEALYTTIEYYDDTTELPPTTTPEEYDTTMWTDYYYTTEQPSTLGTTTEYQYYEETTSSDYLETTPSDETTRVTTPDYDYTTFYDTTTVEPFFTPESIAPKVKACYGPPEYFPPTAYNLRSTAFQFLASPGLSCGGFIDQVQVVSTKSSISFILLVLRRYETYAWMRSNQTYWLLAYRNISTTPDSIQPFKWASINIADPIAVNEGDLIGFMYHDIYANHQTSPLIPHMLTTDNKYAGYAELWDWNSLADFILHPDRAGESPLRRPLFDLHQVSSLLRPFRLPALRVRVSPATPDGRSVWRDPESDSNYPIMFMDAPPDMRMLCNTLAPRNSTRRGLCAADDDKLARRIFLDPNAGQCSTAYDCKPAPSLFRNEQECTDVCSAYAAV